MGNSNTADVQDDYQDDHQGNHQEDGKDASITMEGIIEDLEVILPKLEQIRAKCLNDERFPVITNGEYIVAELRRFLAEVKIMAHQ